MASSTNEWSPPPRVLHQGPRQQAASMTVCSNAVENLHIGALTRETNNVKIGKTQVWESLRDSGKATMKTYC